MTDAAITTDIMVYGKRIEEKKKEKKSNIGLYWTNIKILTIKTHDFHDNDLQWEGDKDSVVFRLVDNTNVLQA